MFFQHALFFLIVLANLIAASNHNVNISNIQIIPGEGLPSLESLNITVADLYNMSLRLIENNTSPSNPSRLGRRGVQRAGDPSVPGDDTYFRDTAGMCISYLRYIGDFPDLPAMLYQKVLRQFSQTR
ncbi:hypothetical protein B0T16DRAFT_459960 [Cercophora newfieldiana]|uniref:Uncharacterized protein n=1 Tax=Cercophora newfieldiana TaxID=92897 RepID=A0AA39Y0Q9_9PEZI|nr:hypothetical protein B0T16DRAFT_459960 [Cercophora newfieldiana]